MPMIGPIVVLALAVLLAGWIAFSVGRGLR